MKVVLCLIILCIMMTLSDGACFTELPKAGTKGCKDPHDKKLHPPASKWKTNNCLDCTCDPKSHLNCCSKHGVLNVPGCKSVVDVKTCKITYHKAGDPSEPCPTY